MLVADRSKCREVKGPTPYSVAVREKLSTGRVADQLMVDRQRRDDEREKVLAFTHAQKLCDLRSDWMQHSHALCVSGAVHRRVKDALERQQEKVHERRDRLRAMLEDEDRRLLQELENKMETSAERQAKMRSKAKELRETRERNRQLVVAQKLEQQFRLQCAELRPELSHQNCLEVSVEREEQVRSNEREAEQHRLEEEVFAQLWEADRQAKEERERMKSEIRQKKNEEQLNMIKEQMGEHEADRERERQLKEEEAQLMLQQKQLIDLQLQREQQQKVQEQMNRRRHLDQGLRMKMKRVARENQDELEFDMKVLKQLLQQESDQKQEVAQRKMELRAEQQCYREYLDEQMKKEKEMEVETDRLMESKLKEIWREREAQNQRRRDATDRLMAEVMETRSLQIQQKLKLNQQKQVELATQRKDLRKLMEDMKMEERDEKRRHSASVSAYRGALLSQMDFNRQEVERQKQEVVREHEEGANQKRLYEKRRDAILSANSRANANKRMSK